jgi:hypothetical protein
MPGFSYFEILHIFYSPTLEYACPLWHFSLSKNKTKRLESVQKRALKITAWEGKLSYSYFLQKFKIKTLENRRHDLCLRFGGNARTNIRTEDFFPHFHNPERMPPLREAKNLLLILEPVKTKTKRYLDSFIPTFTKILNTSNTS